jgi:hypothetical protein
MSQTSWATRNSSPSYFVQNSVLKSEVFFQEILRTAKTQPLHSLNFWIICCVYTNYLRQRWDVPMWLPWVVQPAPLAGSLGVWPPGFGDCSIGSIRGPGHPGWLASIFTSIWASVLEPQHPSMSTLSHWSEPATGIEFEPYNCGFDAFRAVYNQWLSAGSWSKR